MIPPTTGGKTNQTSFYGLSVQITWHSLHIMLTR